MPSSKKIKRRKTNRRQKSAFPAFKPTLNLKSRNDEIFDIDYLSKLNPEEKAWMNNFMEEWINANPNHSGKVFHKTKKQRKIIYDRNNARNRDSFTQAKVRSMLDYSPNNAFFTAAENPLDSLILQYDLKNNSLKKKRKKKS